MTVGTCFFKAGAPIILYAFIVLYTLNLRLCTVEVFEDMFWRLTRGSKCPRIVAPCVFSSHVKSLEHRAGYQNLLLIIIEQSLLAPKFMVLHVYKYFIKIYFTLQLQL